jgi:hypothetical protein
MRTVLALCVLAFALFLGTVEEDGSGVIGPIHYCIPASICAEE